MARFTLGSLAGKAALIGALVLGGCGLLPEQIDETAGWNAQKLYSEAKTSMGEMLGIRKWVLENAWPRQAMRNCLFLNTGTGLSQHICYLLSKKDQYPHLRYRMLFGVRTENDMYYQKQMDELTQELKDFKFEFVLSRPQEDWKGKKGYVQNFISEFDYKNIPTTFYLCGNGGMIKEVKHQLLEVDGLDKSRIWSEAFD